MKKVLIIITTGLYKYGGLSIVALNYLQNMNRKDLMIDFCSCNKLDEDIQLILETYKCRYFRLPSRKNRTIAYFIGLKILCKKEKYDIIHIHGNSSTMIIELCAGLISGVKRRIAHCHTLNSNYPLLNAVMSPFFRYMYTDAIATSNKAGKWLFVKNYIVLNNAVELKKYIYSENNRKLIREQLGIGDKYVIGTVGKLNAGKNYEYMMDVFSIYVQNHCNTILMIIGGGEREEYLRDKAKRMGIEDKVLFLGMQKNVEKFYSSMDLFIFTSLFEGFGMALLEAQISGLKVISSNRVPLETKVTDRIQYLELDDNLQNWVKAIESNNTTYNRVLDNSEYEYIKKCGFDITVESDKLREIYLST